jgi:hypothetical protein
MHLNNENKKNNSKQHYTSMNRVLNPLQTVHYRDMYYILELQIVLIEGSN